MLTGWLLHSFSGVRLKQCVTILFFWLPVSISISISVAMRDKSRNDSAINLKTKTHGCSWYFILLMFFPSLEFQVQVVLFFKFWLFCYESESDTSLQAPSGAPRWLALPTTIGSGFGKMGSWRHDLSTRWRLDVSVWLYICLSSQALHLSCGHRTGSTYANIAANKIPQIGQNWVSEDTIINRLIPVTVLRLSYYPTPPPCSLPVVSFG